MNEPTNTKNLKDFSDLTVLTTETPILGIGDLETGNGVKFPISTLLASSVSPVSSNLLTIGADNKLYVPSSGEIVFNNPFSLFESKYSECIISNLSWLRSNGQWNSGETYVDAYAKLLAIYRGEETIEGITVKSVDDETITDYDFVIDTTNTRFKLPLLNGNEMFMTTNEIQDIFPTIDTTLRSFVAPANGYVFVKFFNGISGTLYAYINDIPVSVEGAATATNGSAFGFVRKGDAFQVMSGGAAQNIDTRFIYAQGNGNLYYYVGEVIQNANLIDAGKINEEIVNINQNIGEIQSAINTIDTKTSIYLKTSYINGASGYNIWSNGYCEQWGRTIGTNRTALLKAFRDGNYNVQGTTWQGGNYNQVRITGKGVDFITWWAYDGYNIEWKASGYVPEGSY